ncbi:MAG: discoidin domain-containing protein [Pirellulales bacterium]|nr:discoidin domain-containing protein [Pirellulales bacterium]
MKTLFRIVGLFFFSLGANYTLPAAAESPMNLALDAQASASESLGGLTPEKAIDGKPDTRWSGIPGHNEGVWFQLDWKEPVAVGQVAVHQFDAFASEWDIQIREENSTGWKTVQHCGKPRQKLPKVAVGNFSTRKITALRIANITGGPSFNEVAVYDRPYADGLATNLASDLRGRFLGIVSDASGATPIEGADVTLSGKSIGGLWKVSSISDANGLFSAAMPLGMIGPIEIRTELKTSEIEAGPFLSQTDSAAFLFRLTPREARRNAVNLSGQWKFRLDPPDDFWKSDFDDADWREIKVPAHWEMEGFHNDSGIGGYRLRFASPTGPGRVKLAFEGVYSGAEAWVNGRLVALHEGGATPFEADITDAVQKGENLLALRVKEHTTTSGKLDHMSMYADFPLAGIFRPVYLFTVPEVHLAGLEITTAFDKEYRDAVLKIRGCVANESSQPFDGILRFGLHGPLPGKEEVARSQSIAVEIGPWQSKEVEIFLSVAAPQKWDAEHPNLYKLSTLLTANRDVPIAGPSDRELVEDFSTRVGFRQTDVRGTEILVNGRPVKFRGTCRHDGHPLLGRAATAELTRQDLLLIKEANLNALRTSHYPPVPELLDLADELGIYIEDEASFCWAEDTNDLRNVPRMLQLEAELLARDRNHAAVAYWSLSNESSFGYGSHRCHEWVRAADPSRPTSAGSSARLELATLHNPLSIPRMQAAERLDRPMLFDESLMLAQGIFEDVGELWLDPGIRDYYIEPYPAIYDYFMKSKTVQGSFIWCWADDLFCVPGRGFEYGRDGARCFFIENCYRLPGRGIVGDAPWGVVDGWRRKKPEFWLLKKLHSPVKLEESVLPLPAAGEPIRVPVENQFDFTNLAELTIHWTLGNRRGEVQSDVPPRSAGTLVIQPGGEVKDGDILALEFKNRDGLSIDSYRVPLGREPSHPAPGEKCESSPLNLLKENLLAGTTAVISGRDFRLALAEKTGLLLRGVVKGEAVLLELPMLHVLPTASAQRPLPDRLSWRLDKIELKKDGENVRASISGRYRDFRGGYELTITPAGELTIDSSFEYAGDDLYAREIGLRFSAPKDCDTLEWDRRAEWNVYPADHIGRPRGTARAFPKLTGEVPPTGPWSEDLSPMGSNDFRGTKRYIYWAAIHYPGDRPGAVVESDGRQHVRANVESDRISVHVNDWYGGTNCYAYGEWHQIYGKGRLVRKGEILASKLQLNLCPCIQPAATARPRFARPVLAPETPADEPVLRLDSRRELFVDSYLIEKLVHARLALNRPRDEGIVLQFDKPWEGPFSGYCTVIRDGPKYRLYYRGLPKSQNDGDDLAVTCMAESVDGVRWTKPELGLFEVGGTRANNVVLAGDRPYSHNFSPFLDARPGVPVTERYKALAGLESSGGLAAYASPDGLRWRKLAEEPVLRHSQTNAFDSQNVGFWSPMENCYVCYYRTWSERNGRETRRVSRATSKDFLHWTPPELMEYRQGDRAAPLEQLYTNQTQPYFRAPQIYLGLAARFMPGRQVVTAAEAEAIGVDPRYFRDCSDVVLMSSRGGNVYQRAFPEGFVRPGIGPENWISRTNYPALGIVQTAPDTMSFYTNCNYGQPTACLRRYSLRLDGFGSVWAPYDGGQMLTRPIIFSGKRLTLNFATSAAGGIRIEIQEPSGEPIPGYTLAESNELVGNAIERSASWKGGENLGALAGRPIRLRIAMKDADLYSLKFSE